MDTNKESEKDLLFSKLLPALNSNPFSSTYVGEVFEEAPAESQPSDVIAALRSQLFGRGMSYSADAYASINVVEGIVLKQIDQVIRRFNACCCDRCRCDIASQALSNLPPKYIVADPKKQAQVEEEIDTKQVMNAIINAVLVARAKPRH